MLPKLSLSQLVQIGLAPLLVFLLNYPFLEAGFYERYEHFDVLMHGLGGASIAYAWLQFERFANIKPHAPWYQILITLGIVALVSILWEFYEFAFDIRDGFPLRQISLHNVMKDFASDLTGGLLVALILGKKKDLL